LSAAEYQAGEATNPTTAKLSAIATNPTFTPAITGNLTAVAQQRKSSEKIKPAAILVAEGRRSQNVSRTPGKNCAAPLVATRSMLTNVLLAVAQPTKAKRATAVALRANSGNGRHDKSGSVEKSSGLNVRKSGLNCRLEAEARLKGLGVIDASVA
jgi:hypothetical protein